MPRIDRRAFLSILTPWVVVAPLTGEAQQTPKVARIGFLSPTPLPPGGSPLIEAFRVGLRELGYVENQTIVIEWRFTTGEPAQLAHSAAELAHLNTDVIVAQTIPAAQAARNATSTVPIVFTQVADTVAAGLVGNLARPGGNITGLTTITREMSGKRLQLLKEILPGLTRAAVVWNTRSEGAALVLRELQAASRQLGIRLDNAGVREVSAIDNVIASAVRDRSGALLVIDDPTITAQRARIIELATKNRLPVISQFRQFAEAGGVLAYGPDLREMYRRTATYVVRILKGAKPADLPVEQPTKFELVINARSAKALGLTVPQSLLLQADDVIQ